MTKQMMSAILILVASQWASAHEFECQGGGRPEIMGPPHGDHEFILPGVLNDRPEPKEGPCADLKLDKEQKAQIRAAFFKFKDEQIELEAVMKKAHLNQMKIASDPGADFDAAEVASVAKQEAMGRMMRAMDTYRNGVMFKILKPDQRSLARACWREEHHHHWGHHPDMMNAKHDQKDKDQKKGPKNGKPPQN